VDPGRLGEACDDDVIGLIAAPGAAVTGTAGMPEGYLDPAGAEVKRARAGTRQAAGQALGLDPLRPGRPDLPVQHRPAVQAITTHN
jgi:hypothetical protein